jgi:lysophospholipase L1-like esterase
MCIGDSNTQGGGVLASFRYPLWFDLNDSGRLVDFVGTRFSIVGENGTTNPSPTDFPEYFTSFDRDHEGYSGFRTDEVLPLVGDVVASQTPDVCLILLGTNDVGQRGAAAVQAGVMRLEEIVGVVRSQAPATVFLIATIPPFGAGSWYLANAEHVPDFNSLLTNSVPTWSTPGSPTVLVDLYSVLDVTTDLRSDGVHFNAVGQSKVAHVIHDALIAALDGGLLPTTLATASLQEPSFETLGLVDYEHSTLPLMDWVFPDQPNLVTGTFNPGSDSYQNADGFQTPAGAEGDEVLSLENSGGDPSLGWVYQVLPTTLESGKTYGLEMAVGRRLPGNSRSTTAYGGYELQVLAGNRVIASSSNQVTPIPGTFSTDQLLIATDDLEAPPLGSPISVRMRLTWSDVDSATDFDWVRLSVH